MERWHWATRSITHTTTTYPTESDIKTAIAQLLGYEEQYLTVTFKDIPAGRLQWTGENLLYWGDTPNWEDLTGQIIIDIDKNVWHFSEIVAHQSSGGSHPYDHTIPIKGCRLILDRNSCLTTWGGSPGNYRLILPLNYWDLYSWINIDSTNANNKDIFYINHGTSDPVRVPLDPPSPSEYTGEWAEQYIINGENDWEGRTLFNQWAQNLGFLFGQAYSIPSTIGSNEHWVKLSWNINNPYPSLYFKGYMLVFKTEINRSKIKFVSGSSALPSGNNVYKESDDNGQILFTSSPHNNSVGYLLGLREINISMQAENCYQWDNQPIEGFINLTSGSSDYRGYAPNTPLLDGGGHFNNDEFDQLISEDAMGADDLLYAYGGMVNVQNFEILKDSNDHRNYRGYSPLYTRQSYQQTEGNFVYDDGIIIEPTESKKPPFNKNYQWNITRPIPILIWDGMMYGFEPDSITINQTQVYFTWLDEQLSIANYDPIKDRIIIYRKNADFDNWQDAVNKLAPVYTTINPEILTPSCWDCHAYYRSAVSLWDFDYWLIIATTAANYDITINTSHEIFEVNNNVFDTKTITEWISSSTGVSSTYPRYNIYNSIIKTKQIKTNFTWGEGNVFVPGYTYDNWGNNHRVVNALGTSGDPHSYLDFTKKLNYNFTINDWGLLHYDDDDLEWSFADESLTAYSSIHARTWGMYFDKAVRVRGGTQSGYKTLFEHWPHSIINPSCAYNRSPGEIGSSANGQTAYLSLADCGWDPGVREYGYVVVLWKNVCQ